MNEKKFSRHLFGDDFVWGVSTAAFQIEGAHDAHGKGLSIWDVFTQKRGKILNGENAVTTTDFYNRYREDIDLVKQMGIPNFRFSISWTRILPKGTGAINQPGIDYYNNVIDYCLQQGIEPWPTLYHWDLPHELELLGGWTNREVVSWFSNYVTICANSFGDRVKHWMVMNEPSAFVGAGYFLGIHAPGKSGLRNFLPAVHHSVLAMATGGRVVRELLPDAQIGTTFSCSYVEPYSDKPRDVNAANRIDALLNRLYIEPVLGLGYPVTDLPVLIGIQKYMQPGDEQTMQFDFDFIGVQNYTREVVRYSFFTPYLQARLVKAKDRNMPTTLMGWEVYPESIYNMIRKYDAYEGVKLIYITENGAAFPDTVIEDAVLDEERTQYLQSHIAQVLSAKNDGCKVNGYFIWTLTDNFEWAEGYHPRFGLIHVDFQTQKRIIKDSGKWYGEFLR